MWSSRQRCCQDSIVCSIHLCCHAKRKASMASYSMARYRVLVIVHQGRHLCHFLFLGVQSPLCADQLLLLTLCLCFCANQLLPCFCQVLLLQDELALDVLGSHVVHIQLALQAGHCLLMPAQQLDPVLPCAKPIPPAGLSCLPCHQTSRPLQMPQKQCAWYFEHSNVASGCRKWGQQGRLAC